MGKSEDDAARGAERRQRPGRPPADWQHLLHELQVHQVELETQNEELRQAQAELEQARTRYFELYHLAPVGYCTLAGSGLLLEANQTAMRMLGRPLGGMVGRPFSSFIHREDRSRFHALRSRFLASGEPFTCDVRLVPRHGPPLWTNLALKAAVGSNPGGTGGSSPGATAAPPAWVVLTDLSQRRQAEEDQARMEAQVRHAHRLDAIGRLAGGLAHDFNNLLGAMAGNLDLLRLQVPGLGLMARLDALDQLVARAGEQVARLLTFAGRGATRMQILDLNQQVEAMAGLLRSSLPARTELRLQLGAGLPPMEGDPTQIQQVILSLVLNAAEALGEQGGTIALDTRRVHLEARDLGSRRPGQPLAPGPHLALSVADPGPGMPPEVRERMFEPYFSTRFAGRGLGLAVVHGVLAAHRGSIRVDSREGQGTQVTVLFPARTRPVAPEIERPAVSGVPPGDGQVLLVEDEEALRSVAAQALRQLGYEPVEAADGLEALRRFESHRAGLRLVFMDLSMPNLDGEATYRALRLAGAAIPILLTSGFPAEEALRPFRGRSVAGFLAKPYRLPELAGALRGALDRPALREPLAWGRELATGHPTLDGHHQDLLQAYNRIVLAVAGGEPGEPERALARLVDAAIAHFGLEEGLMQATGCPGLRRHQAVHAQLVIRIRELAQRIQRGEAGFSAGVLDFLQDGLVCHIQAEDQGMARHLERSGH